MSERTADGGGCEAGGARRVLVVTGDLRFGHLLRAFLELKGYVVEVAAAGAARHGRACTVPPDILVLDLAAAGAWPLTAARSLRGAAPGVPLVVLADPPAVGRLQRAFPGAEVVGRPDDPLTVIAAVGRQLAAREECAPTAGGAAAAVRRG